MTATVTLTANQQRALAVLVAAHHARRVVFVSNQTSGTADRLLRIQWQQARWLRERGYIEEWHGYTVRLTAEGRELAIGAGYE